MTARLVIFAALLCALPASGDDAKLSQRVVDILSPLDVPLSREQVDFAFQPGSGLAQLTAIARTHGFTSNFGVELRAIRTLPRYCPAVPAGCATSGVHDTLLAIVQDYTAALASVPPPVPTAEDLLRLRAAVEALGATQSGLAGDADALTTGAQPLLHDPSRDVRATVVRALRDLCSAGRCTPDLCRSETQKLRELLASDPSAQVQAAVVRALQDLAPCTIE